MKVLLLLALTITSCSGTYTNINIRPITMYTTYTIDIPRPDRTLATCFYSTPPVFSEHYIEMDVDKINAAGRSYRMILLHEYGHCQFGLDHVQATYFDDGCVRELMATYLEDRASSNACYAKHHEFYEAQFKSWETCDVKENCPVQEFIW